MISFSCVQTSPIRASIHPSASFHPLVEKASSSSEHTKSIKSIHTSHCATARTSSSSTSSLSRAMTRNEDDDIGGKRPRGDVDDEEPDGKRRPVLDESFFDAGYVPSGGDAFKRDGEALLAEAETRAGFTMATTTRASGEPGSSGDAEAMAGGELTAKHARRLALAFERAYAENVKARAKYANSPEKFLESEIELDAEVKRLGSLAAAPELYPELVKLNVTPSLVAVLGHENEDVVADALEVLRELTDGDAVESDEESGRALANALRENGAYVALYAALVRFEDESGKLKATTSDASNAVSAVLGIVENLGEIVGTRFDGDDGEARNEALEAFCDETDLLSWLLKRVEKKRVVDQNKLYASEILAIVLQSSAKCRRKCVEMNGLESLLQAVSAYKKKEPEDDGEKELVENLFDSICAVVMVEENKAQFVNLEGIELMLILLSSGGKKPSNEGKKSSTAHFVAVPALKCLDYVLSGNKTACERFVDALGLKSLFSMFMGRNAKTLRKALGNEAVLEQEIRAASVVCSLFKNIENVDRRDRLCAKFVEQDFAKCDRLVELWVEFAKRVSVEQARLEDDADTGIELTEEEEYLQKLDAGLATLEHLSLVFAHLWATEHGPIARRLYLDASQNSIELVHVRDILRQHAHHVGDGAGDSRRAATVAAVLDVLPYAPGERQDY